MMKFFLRTYTPGTIFSCQGAGEIPDILPSDVPGRAVEGGDFSTQMLNPDPSLVYSGVGGVDATDW